MNELKVDSPLGITDYKITGEDSERVKDAWEEFKQALEYIKQLPYNMTNTNEQIEEHRRKIEKEYNVKIETILE